MFGWTKENAQTTARMVDATGAYDGAAVGAMTGLVAGTKVATAIGWRPVEAVAEGDQVLTFDGGMQTVVRIQRKPLWNGTGPCPARFWPLEVPAEALGNRETMYLLPEQGVVVESDAAEEFLGDPFALMPAAALDGVRGIARVALMDQVEVITLFFEEDQVVFANSGALFFCPSAHDIVVDLFKAPTVSNYSKLPMDQACALAQYIEAEYEEFMEPAAQAPMYAVA